MLLKSTLTNTLTHLNYYNLYKILSPNLKRSKSTTWPKIETNLWNFWTVCHERWAKMLKIGVNSYTHISQNMTVVRKLKEVIVYELVLRNNLSQFFPIHLHVSKIATAKTWQNQETQNLEKWCLEMASILPIPDTCTKPERGYCSSACYGETPLFISQNSFWFS